MDEYKRLFNGIAALTLTQRCRDIYCTTCGGLAFAVTNNLTEDLFLDIKRWVTEGITFEIQDDEMVGLMIKVAQARSYEHYKLGMF